MKAILIFDNINDLLFSKWDDDFLECIKSFNDVTDDSLTDNHNVSQLLSPIITSQRVMAAQFGNTYSSMQCKDKTTIVFDEWLDHVFLIISKECVDEAHRELLDCKTFVQHICGQNINLLQSSMYKNWLSVLLESRGKGDSVPGASGVIGECGATAAALSALKAVSKDIKSTYSHLHLMLYVGDKLLALYSSRGCEDLTPSDLILMSIECIAAQEFWNCNQDTDGENNIQLPWLSAGNGGVVSTCAGAAGVPSAPHAMFLAPLAQRIVFVILVDMDLRDVGISMQMSSQILSNLSRLLLQRNMEMLSNTLDALEVALKKTSEALRKSKYVTGGGGAGARLAHSMAELRRAYGVSPLASDTAAAALHTALQAALQLLPTQPPQVDVANARRALKTSLAPYIDFLQVKAMRFFSLGLGEGDSGSLTLHKYVEEFPGLVHFVYVDRSTGRFLAPDLADCADMVTPEAVRLVVSRALSALREGYCAASWRRGALHACALQWWERRSQPVSPARPPHVAAVRALPPPGDILNAFYRQLVEMAFPKDSEGVCVKELVCIHLGLVPAATAVQQARRLAHAVHEIAAARAPAADLL